MGFFENYSQTNETKKNGIRPIRVKKNPYIIFDEILKKNLQVMDISAVKLIQDKNIEIRVFSMDDSRNFLRVASGEDIGTTCKKGE